MARSGKTISFHVLTEMSDRGTRRDVSRNRHGWSVGDYYFFDMTVAPQTEKVLALPENFLYIATNADNIVLDYVRDAQTTTFKIKNILFLSDFTGVTSLKLRNTALVGTPVETLRIKLA